MNDEQTMNDIDDNPEESPAEDRARLKRVAVRHGAAVLAALTLWGVSDAWATSSDLLLAQLVTLFNAVFAGAAIAFIAHEWGHFAGARLSGAASPVLKAPQSFFMFTFKDDLNTRQQFLTMSAGGPGANWLLVVLMFFLLPLETWSQSLFLATTLAIAVSVSVFEVPIMRRVTQGGNPTETIRQRLEESGATPRNIGIAAGAVVWLLAI